MKENIDLEGMILKSFLDNKLLLASIGVLFTGYWFQDVMFSRNFGKILANIPDFVKTLSFSSVLAIVFPYVVAHFLFYIDDIIQGNKFPDMELTIIHELIDKVFESIKTSKKQVNVNELILNLKNVLDIKNIYTLIIIYVVPTVLIATALLYYFITSDIKMGMFAIVLMVMFIYLSIDMEKTCVDISEEHEKSVAKLYDDIQDIMINNDTILTFNTKDAEMQKMKISKDVCSKKHTKSELISGETTFKLNSLSMIMMLALDGIAVKLYMDDKIGAEVLISICMMAYTFIQYYNSSIFKFKSVTHYIGKYNELKKYFSKFEINHNESSTCLNITNGDVIFKDVQIIHDSTPMPNKLNFVIKGKSKTGITGEIGTGKTSILKILAGLKNYVGDVSIDNQDISNCTYESMTENIIYIPQHPKLFNRTIYENLAYGTNASVDEIKEIIKKYKIGKFFKKFPNGIMENVGKEGSKLSGGQKQIMALIRAIIQQRKIILLDEPTSSLDAETKKIFMDLIESITDKTIIVVTHDKTIYNLFDNMLEL
jgi:ABC-type multidrug transport system fused ATPase/permease subunit